jgi:hypothetical protein
MTALNEWENFYLIVGPSAGVPIGLQFVVITLIADGPMTRGDAQAGGAFATPSVVHFGVVLLLASIVSAPLERNRPCRTSMGLSGPLWGIVLRHRGSAHAIANHLPARIRGLVVSFPASICGLCITGCIGIHGSILCASSPVPSRCGNAAVALHWHSQCLGCSYVSRLCQIEI